MTTMKKLRPAHRMLYLLPVCFCIHERKRARKHS